jgi:hypothetical protein
VLNTNKYRNLYSLPVFLIAIFLCNLTNSQIPVRQDPITKIHIRTLVYKNNKLTLSSSDTSLASQPVLKPPSYSNEDKTYIFLDSLRNRASKSLITSKLYDFVIIPEQYGSANGSTGESDLSYLGYSGKKIRKIEIERLDVFGTNVNYPSYYNPNNIEKLLNKTHFSTNEFIIRKNLLFTEGDTVSPLIMSDNERILRQLPYIDDARIIVSQVSEEEVDVVVRTKDIYSLGAGFSYTNIEKGTVSLFEKNIFGMGHEFGIEVPYDADASDSPGFGVKYNVNNIIKSFIDLNLYFTDGLGEKSYGFGLNKRLLSSTTKYAAGISIRQMITSEDLDTLSVPAPLKYNLQDYWILRSFLIDKESVKRIIFGIRYTNNNVFDRPYIMPDSYYYLQNYRLFLGSAAFSMQKYYKTNLIYSYGRTEDIPYGGLVKITAGKEYNEFKKRTYLGIDISSGILSNTLGYFYASAGLAAFVSNRETEQGLFLLKIKHFSNLFFAGRSRLRNFVSVDYTRGFDRYADEYLRFENENGLSGFRNDSLSGNQRLTVSIESVLFSPLNLYGFRFALFGFTDLSLLSGSNELIGNGNVLTGIGLGLRIRNDNLVFNTFQLRLGFFPNLPAYSKISNLIVSGEQLLRSENFDPGPPSIIPYR